MSDDEPIDQDDDELPARVDDSDNAADPARLVKKKRRISRKQAESAQFWRGVLAEPVGRREIYELLKETGLFETPFAVGPNGFPQPEASWYRAGAHACGQRMFLKWTLLARQGVFMMLDENDPKFTAMSALEGDL